MTIRNEIADNEVQMSGPGSTRTWAVLAGVMFAAVSAFAAAPPIVDQLFAVPPVVAPGDTAVFTVEAHDPDCPDVCTSGCGMYIRQDLTDWTADGGTILSEDNGTSGSPYTALATWQAPMVEGTYTISVYLADSGSFFCGGRQSVWTDLTIQVTVSANQPPVIDSLVADPPQVRPLQNSDLACAASDPDGDPLSFAWEADVGTVTVTGGGTAVFTAPGVPGVAIVTCTASDPEGFTGSQSVAVSVSDAVPSGTIGRGLGAPQSIAVDDFGNLFVVDRWAGGLAFSNLFDDGVGRVLPIDDLGSVALDWNDRLLIGTASGARVIDRDGNTLLPLIPPDGFGPVADVAVDHAARRYIVLYRNAARIAVYSQVGSLLHLFGSTGTGPGEMNLPGGIAVSPAGEIVVADTGRGLVQVFSGDGAYQRSFGGLGNGAGEFVSLVGVAVDGLGRVFASDAFHSRVQVFDPDGTLREILGWYGPSVGEFKTPIGLVVSDAYETLAVTSFNTPSVELFSLGDSVFDPPSVAVSPTAVAFGNQTVGTVSTARTVTLVNTGTVSVSVYGADVTGDFTVGSGCDSNLAPGSSCEFSVTFAPTSVGPLSGDLVIATSAVGGPHAVPLSGTGIAVPEPAAVLNPTALDFGEEYVGAVSTAQTIVLSNPGTAPLTIGGITTGAEFPVSTGCGSTLAPGGSCSINIRFAPAGAGPVSAMLTVTTDAVGSPHQAMLTGVGVDPPMASVAPGSIDFGVLHIDTVSDPVSVIITNVGTALLTVTDLVLQGEFTVTDSCYTALPPGGQCNAFVRFAPVSVGPLTGSLVVVTDSPAGPHTVALSGAGVGDPVVAVDPAVLVFETSTVGRPLPAQSVEVTNAGEGPLEILSAAIDGHWRDFTVTADTCTGAQLPPSATCTIEVTFEPILDGDRSAVLTIASNAASSPTMISLSGVGAYITTFLTTGQDPPDAFLCGDEDSVPVDTFSLWTNRDVDHVDQLRVDMATGSAELIGLIEILDADGLLVGAHLNPTTDRVFVDVDLEVTVEPGDFSIRLTPRNQADMPPPPGGELVTWGYVGMVVNDNLTEGIDESWMDLVIDNQSPDAPVFQSADPLGNGINLIWTNPDDPDFQEVVVLRAQGAEVVDRPTEGMSYSVGDAVGVSTVACVGTATSCFDDDLYPGLFYHYAFFARDECGNYSEPDHSGAVQAPLGEAIPTLDGIGRLLLMLLIGLAGIGIVRWRKP